MWLGSLVVVIWDQGTGQILWQRTYDYVPTQGQVSLDGFLLPDYITLVGFQVTWVGSTSMFTRFSAFVVLDEPKEPMSPAWVNLLLYSCWWGRFKSNFDDAAQAITFGVFFQRLGFAYPQNSAAYWIDIRTTPPTFKLKAVLDKWNEGQWVSSNCVDVSCFTMLALCSVGMDFSTRQLTGTVDPSYSYFLTNPICPIGSDPTPGDDPSEPPPPFPDYTYQPYQWVCHQVCVLTGSPDPPSSTGIWDPTAAQKKDLDGNSYRNPPAHHPNHLWPESVYWQKWIEDEEAPLGLISKPQQTPSNPHYPNDPPFWVLRTWKCRVDAEPWPPLQGGAKP